MTIKLGMLCINVRKYLVGFALGNLFCSLSVCSDGSATQVIHHTIGCDIYYLLGSSSTLSSLMDRSLNVEVCSLFIRGEKLLVQLMLVILSLSSEHVRLLFNTF